MRQYVLDTPFASLADEIRFFKEIKPLFYAPYIFHHKVFCIERDRPAGSIQVQLDYLNIESQKVKLFHDANITFYRYYRSGSADADQLYFTRGHLLELENVHPSFLQADPQFSTGYDYILARTMANDMINDYLNKSLYVLLHPEAVESVNQRSQHKWTGPIIDLAELIYMLIAHHSVDNGKVSAKGFSTALASFFNVKIDYIAKKFEEIRMRKKNRTAFIDGGKRSLLRKMEEDDEYAL